MPHEQRLAVVCRKGKLVDKHSLKLVDKHCLKITMCFERSKAVTVMSPNTANQASNSYLI